MTLKSGRPLPKRYARSVNKETRKLVNKRYERRKQLKKERIRRSLRRVQQLFARWKREVGKWVLVTSVSIVILIIGLLLFSPLLEVREISVKRLNPRLDTEEVQQVLSSLFGKHMVFLQGSEIDELLRTNILDIYSVQIRKKYPSTLSVSIELDPLVAKLEIVDPNKPQAVEESDFSQTGALLTTEGEIFSPENDYITSKGTYVNTVVQEGNELPLIRIVDWGVRPMPNDSLVDIELLERMHSTEVALESQFNHSVSIRAIYLRAREFHFFADGLSYWFDMTSSLDEQLKRYRTFLQYIPREEVIQYIDLRLTDRVVYR
ncbi:MAG: FtsQ-type POTRA domain-containing protein [Candidatus Peribacteraceae bacterium]|nr:FtsQ-type POTRA domain-containing protein [Candidatus Peribacteraceae bacterium]